MTEAPAPNSPETTIRWQSGRLRRRLLSGQWRLDLDERIAQHFGPTRRAVMGLSSMARNPFRRLCTELAANYDRPPHVRNVAGELPLLLGADGVLDAMGLWPMQQSAQADLIGLREIWIRLDWSADLGRPVARTVTPDCLEATPHPADPSIPVTIRELRYLSVPGIGDRWAWEEASIADPDAPYLTVTEARGDTSGVDWTDRVYGAPVSGEVYPWRWTQGERAGRPYLPGVLYHARQRGRLWDWTEGQEVVEGTLDVGASYSFLQHVIHRASWPTKVAVGLYPVSSAPRETPDGRARVEVVNDPAAVLHFEHVDANQPGDFKQLPAPDPEAIARTVAMLERSIADFDGLGLTSSSLMQTSSNPWSAAALTITRDDKVRAQQRYTPTLRRGDIDLIERIAAIVNAQLPAPVLPETGYRIDYASVPMARDEADALRAHNAELIAAGRLSIVDAYIAEHPGTTREEAETSLTRIAADNQRYNVRPGTMPAAVVAGGPPAPLTPPPDRDNVSESEED